MALTGDHNVGDAGHVADHNAIDTAISSLNTNIALKAASTDPRFTDQRTPLDSSVTDAKVSSSAAIAQTKISGLTTSLAAKAALTGPFAPTGHTGATVATSYVGGTTSGAPTTGTFSTGDYIIAVNGHVWVCTASGTPGTWVDASSAGGGASLGSTTPQPVGTAAIGVATDAARSDHVHAQQAAVAPTGLSGATSANTRLVGGVNGSGAPASGTFAVGDISVANTGNVWVCITAGSPGTWVNHGFLTSSAAQTIGTTNAAGTASDAARSDHVHAQQTAVKPGGLTGAVAATRYAGGTASGAPSTGTFAVGDFVVAQNGKMYICTSAGSPGTWVSASGADNIYNVVRDYGADNTGTANASSAIQAALDAAAAAGGGSVYVPAGIYKINAKLLMKTRVRLYGDGHWTSRLVLANSVNDHVIQNYVSSNSYEGNGEFTIIENLFIDGNASNQSAGNYYGIMHDMNPQYNWSPPTGPPYTDIEYDPHHVVRNVMITNTKSDGYNGQGRSETYLDRVFTFKTGRYGIRASFDTFLNHCTTAWSASNGFQIEDSSARGTGCKAFYNGQTTLGGSDGHGFFFANGQGGINFVGCEAQDNAGAGFALNNCQRALITGIADTNSNGHIAGRGSGNAGAYPAVDLWSSFDNIIDVVAYERKAYDSTSYQIYGLQVRQNSSGNTIRLKHSATTYNGAAVSTPVMTTSTALAGNNIDMMNQSGNQTIAYSATITPNPYIGGTIRVASLTGNITVNDPATSNRHHGLIMKFIFVQDATGGRTVTWGSGFSPGNWAINTTANQPSAIDFMWDSTLTKWIRCSG